MDLDTKRPAHRFEGQSDSETQDTKWPKRESDAVSRINSSASWDVGTQQASALFRPQHDGSSRILRFSPNLRRVRIASDFSPSSAAQAEAQQLKTPHRIEIEREDALGILACLVERGVSWQQDADNRNTDAKDASEPVEDEAGCDKEGESLAEMPSEPSRSQTPSASDVAAIMKELQAEEGKLEDDHSKSDTYRKRKLVLEELLRSHEYALEMKRASQSASLWLKSIGRSQSASPTKTRSLPADIVPHRLPTMKLPIHTLYHRMGINSQLARNHLLRRTLTC